jgi:hypothetical protein
MMMLLNFPFYDVKTTIIVFRIISSSNNNYDKPLTYVFPYLVASAELYSREEETHVGQQSRFLEKKRSSLIEENLTVYILRTDTRQRLHMLKSC